MFSSVNSNRDYPATAVGDKQVGKHLWGYDFAQTSQTDPPTGNCIERTAYLAIGRSRSPVALLGVSGTGGQLSLFKLND